MEGILADNYQLKWHSHNTHLHSSVATLFKSDVFTDVTLVTADGRCLPAHRFVLSACSSYLKGILHRTPTTSQANLVIILPSEITYRTLAILLQYMYSGEATVGNEELDSILKAGRILQIKGLCKERDEPEPLPHVPLLQKAHLSRYGPHQGRPAHQKGTQRPERCHSSASSLNDDSLHQAPSTSRKLAHLYEGRKERKSGESSKSHDLRSQTPRSDRTVDTSTPDKIPEDISIEDNMKIELLVKEEPLDWNDHDDSSNPGLEGSNGDTHIKTENCSDNECEDSEFAALTCDLCHETFKTPALWVRHIETHPITDVPRRKRRRNMDGDEGEEDEYPELKCELCNEVFHSPGDWVRHIQGMHTEGQLAVVNSVIDVATKVRESRKPSSRPASCPVCFKSFPSLASMHIHCRTHTGERPYVCEVCDKGFNVKSNLLRHLRTLHDHIVPPESM